MQFRKYCNLHDYCKHLRVVKTLQFILYIIVAQTQNSEQAKGKGQKVKGEKAIVKGDAQKR